ncbi:hypothetical protein [Defluviimonas salinarum]|uniref:Uncharacterized protein n=1 Tax=Defluviimonas salinarum TaxID=2992147 RepID=A0ABT3JAM0_9RHOB|nr:hypothetical protein [Defluviimonas salinarum]MCW3784757.1 hypothetical protein [Defluviimonas salinarum]
MAMRAFRVLVGFREMQMVRARNEHGGRIKITCEPGPGIEGDLGPGPTSETRPVERRDPRPLPREAFGGAGKDRAPGGKLSLEIGFGRQRFGAGEGFRTDQPPEPDAAHDGIVQPADRNRARPLPQHRPAFGFAGVPQPVENLVPIPDRFGQDIRAQALQRYRHRVSNVLCTGSPRHRRGLHLPGLAGDQLPAARIFRVGKAEAQVDQIPERQPEVTRPARRIRVPGPHPAVGATDALRHGEVQFKPARVGMRADKQHRTRGFRDAGEQNLAQQRQDRRHPPPLVRIAIVQQVHIDVLDSEGQDTRAIAVLESKRPELARNRTASPIRISGQGSRRIVFPEPAPLPFTASAKKYSVSPQPTEAPSPSE